MTTVTTRAGKGTPLTNAEMDTNLTTLASAVDGHTHAIYHRKHGFEVSSSGAALQTISYDKTTRKITVTPTGASFNFWIDGVQFSKTGAQLSPAHAATTGKHFFYYDSSGNLQTSTTAWSIIDRTVTPVAMVYYYTGLSDGICFYECHTADRVLELHNNLHFTQGTKRLSGFALSGYTLATDSDAAVTFAVAAGAVADEDIKVSMTGVADGGPYTIFWRTGAAGDWTWDKTPTLPFKAGTYPQWNELTGGSWTLTDLVGTGGGEWVNYYLFAITSVDAATQLILIPGQAKHASLASAQAETVASIAWGTIPFEEIAPLYQITFQARSTFNGTKKAELVSVASITSGGASVISTSSPAVHNSLSGRSDTGTHPASAITNTAAGSIAATDVQAAINELDTEKLAKAGGTITGDIQGDQVGLSTTASGGKVVYVGDNVWYDAGAIKSRWTGAWASLEVSGGYVWLRAGSAASANQVLSNAVPQLYIDSGTFSLDSIANVPIVLNGDILWPTSGRLRGNFSDSTHGNRTLFQSSGDNVATSIGVIPNGTGTAARVSLYGASDANNASLVTVGVNQTTGKALFNSAATGTGTVQPFSWQFSNTEFMGLTSSGGLSLSGIFTLLGSGNDTIPALSTALIANEIHAGNTVGSDYGLLRLSAGGGTTLAQKCAIDIQGYGVTDGSQIRFYTYGSEQMRITPQGNVVFNGSSKRIQADFSNATASNRTIFQSSTTNGSTIVGAIPNGTSTSGILAAYNASDADNAAYIYIGALSGENRIMSSKVGSASEVPLKIYTSGTLRMTIAATGTVTTDGYHALGSAAPAIKMKKLTGTTSGSQGGTTSIAHGLTGAKILEVATIVEYATNSGVPPEYTYAGGYQYSVYFDATNVVVQNSAANSVGILTKAIRILITYEE